MVYYTAITLKLNTKPWNEGGVTSRDLYESQLIDLCFKFSCKVSDVCGYELDKQCQLHVHTTLISKSVLHRKKICNYFRKEYKKYSIWLVPITGLKNWEKYCLKTGNAHECVKYEKLCQYYEKKVLHEDVHLLFISYAPRITLNKQNHWEKHDDDECNFID